ncbi:hypothetical protein EPN42_12125 [bacterium]|nr:MAG: hypothetical protein EPN42_12125 [bacterium]
MRYQRGQTLPETVLFLPILLLATFAVIYFSQLGVANERAQLGVRYGGLTSFVSQPTAYYSATDIYAFYESAAGLTAAPCPTAPPGAYTDSAPFPGPSSAPYWTPAQIQPAPTSNCSLVVKNLGGASFLATHYFSATQVSTGATIAVPPYLQSLVGSTFGQVSASESFVHPAYPAVILACTNQQVYNRAFGALFPNASPPPAPPCP